MKKFLLLFVLCLCTSLSAAAQSGRTFYIDYSSGSNSNNGTSKSTPWKSHPYMQTNSGCTGIGSAPSYSHQAGDRFIFKGGVTWPAACFNLQISNTNQGTSSNPDYYGVDLTWFTGDSFTRPLFDLNYQSTTGNFVVGGNNLDHLVFDNFEVARFQMTGSCAASCGGVGTTYQSQGAFNFKHYDGLSPQDITVKNSYIHQWGTLQTTSCPDYLNYGAGGIINASLVDNVEINGDDAWQGTSHTLFRFGGGVTGDNTGTDILEVRNSYIHGGMSGAFAPKTIHDSQISHITSEHGSLDPCIHSQVIENDDGQTETIYNNLIHDNGGGFQPSPGQVGVVIYEGPYSKIFNNVMWANNTSGNGPILISEGNSGPQPSAVQSTYNNTIDCSSGVACFATDSKAAITGTVNLKNNQWITNGGPLNIVSSITTFNNTNNYTMPTSEASTYGFTSARKYFPSSSDSHIVGQGANLTSVATGALAPLLLDTEGAPWYGGAYVTREVPWDLGPYEFTRTLPVPSLSPTSFDFGAVILNTPQQHTSLTLSNSGTIALNVSLSLVTPSTPYSIISGGTCVNGSQLVGGGSCTVFVQFLPTAVGVFTNTLQETDSANGVGATASLTGTGINPPTVGFTPSPVAFGNQQQNVSSSPITVTLTNTGGASTTLSTPYFAITGTNSGDFTVTSQGAPTWTVDQHKLATCTNSNIGAGTYTCVATLGSNVTAGHSLLVLHGTQTIEWSPNSTNFSVQTHNATSGDSDTWTHCPSSAATTQNYLAASKYRWFTTDCDYVLSATGGSAAITASWNVNGSVNQQFIRDVEVYEFHPSTGSTVLDATNGTTSSSCSTCVGPTLSITGTSDIVLPWLVQNQTISSINSPYAIDDSETSIAGAFAHASNQASVTTPSWTTSAAGRADLSIIALSGSALANSCANGGNLAPSATCQFNLTFKPTAGGGTNESATLTVTGSNGVTANVSLTGTSQGAATVATPTFSPVGGMYSSSQTLTITSGTTGATIIYTTDGSMPTENGSCVATGTGTALTNGGSITVSASKTVNAIGCKVGSTDSGVATAVYVISIPTVALPTTSLPGGSYVGSQSAALSSGTTGATIIYTSDGSTPTDNGSCTATGTSTAIASGTGVTISTSETIQFYGCKSGFINSAVVSSTYSIYAGAPVFSPTSAIYPLNSSLTVTITSSTGSTICYTTDASTPTGTVGTCTNGTQIASGSTITVTPQEIVFAIATQSGYLTSGVAGAVYTSTTPPALPILL